MENVVKNPIGERNGELIMIGDLTKLEQGANCNCVCPECGGKFVAKMGSKRVHHFAHEKGAMCDSEKAFLNSLYRLFAEAVTEKGCFVYPGCYGFFPGFDLYKKATMEDIKSVVNFSAEELPEDYDYEPIIISGELKTVRTEIKYNTKGMPEALLVHFVNNEKEYALAVVLIPPSNVCKVFEPKIYKNLPTVAIYVEDDIYHVKSLELKKRLCGNSPDKEWLDSPKIRNWLQKQQQKQHKWVEDRRQRHIGNPQVRQSASRQLCSFSGNTSEPVSDSVQALYCERLTAALTGAPNQLLYAGGRRWCHCEKCDSFKFITEMATETVKINRGICSECMKKAR